MQRNIFCFAWEKWFFPKMSNSKNVFLKRTHHDLHHSSKQRFTKDYLLVHKFIEFMDLFWKTWLLQPIVNASKDCLQKQCKEVFGFPCPFEKHIWKKWDILFCTLRKKFELMYLFQKCWFWILSFVHIFLK